MAETHPEVPLTRLREIEGRLLDAVRRNARFGMFSPRIDDQLRSVKALLAAIDAHAELVRRKP